MLSLAVLTAGLIWASLLIVRRTAEGRVQREIQEESQNAMMTFQLLQHSHFVALMRKADLLASLVSMRNGDPAAIEEVGRDPWQSDECDLLVLSDARGKIVALHDRRRISDVHRAEHSQPSPKRRQNHWMVV
jgi:hypothetical protein